MFCLHHECGGSADGLELFDLWSQQSIGRYCGFEKIAGHWASVRGYERGGRLLTWASVRKWIEGDKTAAGRGADAERSVDGRGASGRALCSGMGRRFIHPRVWGLSTGVPVTQPG